MKHLRRYIKNPQGASDVPVVAFYSNCDPGSRGVSLLHWLPRHERLDGFLRFRTQVLDALGDAWSELKGEGDEEEPSDSIGPSSCSRVFVQGAERQEHDGSSSSPSFSIDPG